MKKSSNIYLFFICLLLTTSCKRYNISHIEEIGKIPLEGKIKFKERYEKWYNLQGHGAAILVFDIKKGEEESILEDVKFAKWNELDSLTTKSIIDFFTYFGYEKEIKRDLQGSKGYFIEKPDPERSHDIYVLILDTIRKKILYTYSFG